MRLLGVAVGVRLRVARSRPATGRARARRSPRPAARWRDRAGRGRRPRPSRARRGSCRGRRVARAAAGRARAAPRRAACAGRWRRRPCPRGPSATSSIALGLALGLLADLAVLRRSRASCGFGQQDGRHDEAAASDDGDRRAPREPRPEQAGLDASAAGATRVAPLAADEARLRGRDVERAVDRDRLVLGVLRPGPRRGVDRRERERRGDARRRGRPRRRPRAPSRRSTAGRARRGREHEQPEHRDRGRDERRLLERHRPLRDPQDELRERDRGERRSTRGGRYAGATAGGDARRGRARSSSQAGSSGTPSAPGSAGTNGDRRRRGVRRRGRGAARRTSASGVTCDGLRHGPSAARSPARVGETSWTDRTMRTSEATATRATAARPEAVARRSRSRLDAAVAVEGGRGRSVTAPTIWHEAPKPVSVPHSDVQLGDERVEPQQRLGRALRQRLDGSVVAVGSPSGRNLPVIADQNTKMNTVPTVSAMTAKS